MNKKSFNIRNFAIIAHIDHGKSTLADRLIQECGALQKRELTERVLDSMDIERERGITIKTQTVRLNYRANNGIVYQLNLMDTPGHVDFSYEVSRALAACEGSLLIVDSTQGVEAQTLANYYQAIDNNHKIISILNKVDLPSADPEKVQKQIDGLINLNSKSILVSSKTGYGIKKVLESLVNNLPSPTGCDALPLKALLIDSWYDIYLGVIILVRVIDGILKSGQKIRMMVAGLSYYVEKVGVFTPKKEFTGILYVGEVGFITSNIKHITKCKVGDTITLDSEKENICLLPGFKPSLPVVFCGLFSLEGGEFENLRNSLAKLQLNDASFHYEGERSSVLGHGFRCGFLGLLHLEIIKERLEREFNLDLISTSPSVVYKVTMYNGRVLELYNPSDIPDFNKIHYISEPWIKATIILPTDKYLGAVLGLCNNQRGEQIDLNYLGNKIILNYKFPLNEIIFNFYDRLKSISKGYASFDYKIDSYIPSDLVNVCVLVNGESIDALSFICHRFNAEQRGRLLCIKLKELIPRKLFSIPIQVMIGNKIVARETISAMRKNVTAKCYGGDITRKRKLLEKQKKGKKKMCKLGNVDIPKKVFFELLKIRSK